MTNSPARPLVFVVGAGASKDFGSSMPVGSELAAAIEQQLGDEFSAGALDGPIKAALSQSRGGLTSNDIRAAVQIRRSIFAQPSIDDLLNEWRDVPEMIRVGKIAIANSILTAERKCSLAVTASGDESDHAYSTVSALRDSWLGLVLRNLVSRREIRKVFDQVGFVVFNYDRCIEQFLYWAFQSVAGLDPGDSVQALEEIPIVHVYGDLGHLPYHGGGPLDVSFGLESAITENVFGRIRTYTEEDHDQENLDIIHTLVQNAKRIVFLGMGYHDRNISLLISGGSPRRDCEIWGTSLNPDASRLQAVQTNFKHANSNRPARLESFDCAAFLRSYRDKIFHGLS